VAALLASHGEAAVRAAAAQLAVTPEIKALMDARLAARKARNWAESDRLRDELAKLGFAAKDGKDPVTGEPVTEWEVVR